MTAHELTPEEIEREREAFGEACFITESAWSAWLAAKAQAKAREQELMEALKGIAKNPNACTCAWENVGIGDSHVGACPIAIARNALAALSPQPGKEEG